MNKENQSAASVAIIGSADGPTSVFLADKASKKPLRFRIRNSIYKLKRRRAAKKITPGAHTLDELLAYAKDRFGAAEVKPEQSEASNDIHLYEIKLDGHCLELEVNVTQKLFGASYSGKKSVMKQFRKIVRDLYLYYGVTENDIAEKTQRYHSLLSVLSS